MTLFNSAPDGSFLHVSVLLIPRFLCRRKRKLGMVQIKVTSLRRVWSPKHFPATKHYEDATFLFSRGYKFKPRVWSRRPHRRGGVCPVTRFLDILNLAENCCAIAVQTAHPSRCTETLRCTATAGAPKVRRCDLRPWGLCFWVAALPRFASCCANR